MSINFASQMPCPTHDLCPVLVLMTDLSRERIAQDMGIGFSDV